MAVTNITGGTSNPLDTINNAFNSIHGMFGGNLSGGGQGAFGMSPQPVSGADNSVTAGQRASMNMLGQMAPTAFGMGQGLLGTGMGVAQGGLDVMGTGLDTLQPSIDFYNKLMSGDPSTMTGALAPTAANIANMFSGLNQQLFSGLPAGGYRATAMANSPFAQTQMVGNAALGLQNQAAQGLLGAGGEQAQIGQNMAGVGTQIGQLGTTLTGQGLSGAQNLAQDLLEKQRINQMDPTMLQQLSQVLGVLPGIGSVLGGISGAIGAGNAGSGFASILAGLAGA